MTVHKGMEAYKFYTLFFQEITPLRCPSVRMAEGFNCADKCMLLATVHDTVKWLLGR